MQVRAGSIPASGTRWSVIISGYWPFLVCSSMFFASCRRKNRCQVRQEVLLAPYLYLQIAKFNSKDYERRNQRFTGARARTI